MGITLDEKLNFGQHIEKKAGNSLGMVREIKRLGQIKTKFLMQIYNSLIGSVLQYASCVWQIGNKDNLDKLNTVQRIVNRFTIDCQSRGNGSNVWGNTFRH